MSTTPTTTVAGALDHNTPATDTPERVAQILTAIRTLTTELETVLTEQEK